MKKLLTAVLSLVIIATSTIPAFATSVGPDIPTEPAAYTVTVNEYDVYVAARNTSNKYLRARGLTKNQISLIKSDAIENELLEIAALSSDELSEMGYDDSQIATLKNYNGQAIEKVPQLRSVFASMTAKFYKAAASTSSLKVRVFWEWSNAPILAGDAITDLIVLRWQGTNTAGQPLNVAYNSSNSSGNINYYNRSGTFQYSRSATVVCDSPYDHAYAKVPLSYGDYDSNGSTIYAKSGTLHVQVDRTGTDSIKEVAFVFSYGHSVITLSPALALPVSFGIGFSRSVETMVEEAIRMDSKGNITAY
jgi:hypothetical protein